MNDDLVVFVGCEFGDAALDGAYGDLRSAEIRNEVLVRLAHIEDEDVFFVVELAFELFYRDLRDAIDDGMIADGLVAGDFEWANLARRRDAAELVVVDQLGDSGVGPADRAVEVFPQLQGAEAHP